MTWTHPSKNSWVCVEHPSIVIRKTRVRGFYGNRYRVQDGEALLGTSFSLGEAKSLAYRRVTPMIGGYSVEARS